MSVLEVLFLVPKLFDQLSIPDQSSSNFLPNRIMFSSVLDCILQLSVHPITSKILHNFGFLYSSPTHLTRLG